jgi:hypothetical protein
MRAYGYGQCKAETNEAFRAGRTFSAQAICRIDKYVGAPVAVIARRERELSAKDTEAEVTK